MCVRKDKKGALHLAVWFGVFLMLVSTICFGQITSSTIVGTVTDASGANVPGAQVTAVNTDTNLSRTVKTNAQGEYRLEFLPVGTYRV